MKQYTEQGDWIEYIRNEESSRIVRVGLVQAAVKEIGPIVWYELPQVGLTVQRGDVAVILESTKAAVDVEAPISGRIVRVNPKLETKAEEALKLLNCDPEHEGWLYEAELSMD